MSNTIHDMGGMHGFGPVEPEPNEPVFHAPWEGRVHAMQRVLGAAGLWSIDGGRASMEVLPPVTYLAASYYQRWFLGLEKRVTAYGLVGADELAAGHSLHEPKKLLRPLIPADLAKPPISGDLDPPASAPAKFKPGDRVRTVNISPVTHTRLPRYARDKQGVVEAIRGCHVYPDTAALDVHNESPQWLYTVVFTGKELWGEDADPAIKVSIEAFEPYLEAT
jgi:nitrile hydratase beta subunit